MTVRSLVLAAAVLATPVGAQEDPPPPPPPVEADSSVDEAALEAIDAAARADRLAAIDRLAAPDTLRALPAPAIVDGYRADPAFQYDDPRAEGPTLWERFWDWVQRTFFDPITENTSDVFWDWALIAFAIAALGWAAARLLQSGGVGVFARAERGTAGAGPLLDAEDIAEVDLGARLRTALAAGDHREAVRVRYLALLQALDAAGLIAWRRDKTNRQYVAEVAAADRDRTRPFRRATAAFDAVWYGERPVSEALYGRLGPVFDRAEQGGER